MKNEKIMKSLISKTNEAPSGAVWGALILLMVCTTACQQEEVAPVEQEAYTHSLAMKFRGDVQLFDGGSFTRGFVGTVWEWQTEDVVILQFKSGNSLIPGYAVYKGNDSWEAFFNGELEGTGDCAIYLFEGVKASEQNTIALTDAIAIYADLAASYAVEKGEIILSGRLSPQTSRMRLAGEKGVTVQVNGIKCCTAYNMESNSFVYSTDGVTRTVGNDGYTPYIYGTFADESSRELLLSNSADDVQYQKNFPNSVMKVGESGFVRIPTSQDYKGWSMIMNVAEKEYAVSGNGKNVTFKMKRVEGGTFTMGYINDESSIAGAHTVTLSKAYYIGETEVTQGLWQAVTGQTPTTDGTQWSEAAGLGVEYPAYYVSYEDCLLFLEKLNTLTGRRFRLPTEAEWEFAAKGGVQTQKFIYAGSNQVEDVAWYKANSGNKTHAVKGLSANELGLYDMSGNVSEWCSDWFADYDGEDATDPIGPSTGTMKMNRGGSWFDSYCRTANRTIYSPTTRSNTIGFRLALSSIQQ